MDKAMTTNGGTLVELIALSEKATQGECTAQEYSGSNWYVRYSDNEDSSGGRKEDAYFDAALRNWFRANSKTLSAQQAELEAMRRDVERWNFYASSPQTALMLGSEHDPNDDKFPWKDECDRLADDALLRYASAIERRKPLLTGGGK